MQHRPDIILAHLALCHPCARGVFHHRDSGFAGMRGAAHCQNFIRTFDRAGFFGELFTFHYFKALRL